MKRFTETEKWRDIWFRSLTPDLKLAWQYICDNCDNSGVWEPDYALADFQIGLNVDWEKAKLQFVDRIKILENGRWYLVGFISFQQKELSPNKPAHKQIFSLCKKHGIDIPCVSHVNGIAMVTGIGIGNSNSKGNSYVPAEYASIMIPSKLKTDRFCEAFREWVIYRKKGKRSGNWRLLFAGHIKVLEKLTEEEAVESLRKSIANGWMEPWYEPKTKDKPIPKMKSASDYLKDINQSEGA